MGRLTDNDKHLGPITYARLNWNPWQLVISSGGEEDNEESGNSLRLYAFGWIVRIPLPNILRPYREKHIAHGWDAATIKRMGRNFYHVCYAREYGFSLHEGFLQVFLGRQTHDSSTEQSWSYFLPWTQWRFIRHSLYDIEGNHFWTRMEAEEKKKRKQGLGGECFKESMEAQDACPSVSFEFEDYDGERIVAKTRIEEREWHFGEKWCSWLSLFRKPKIRRSLDIDFSSQVGPEKGSWKGGTTGHGIEMLSGELHEQAFRRYCSKEHRSKSRNYRIKFIGRIGSVVV